MQRVKRGLNTFKFVGVIYALCLIVNLIIRAILTLREWNALSEPFFDVLKIFGYGLYHDTLYFGYFVVPLLFVISVIPKSAWQHKACRVAAHAFVFIIIVMFSFQAHAEWFFWGEFHSRFNFIAVDYLIYTQEVIGNIRESYPMGWVYASILLTSGLIYLGAKPWISRSLVGLQNCLLKCRLAAGVFMVLAPLMVFYVPDFSSGQVSSNQIVDQLSNNGSYQFVSAFRNNRLDYRSFYPILKDQEVIQIMEQELASSNSRFVETGAKNLGRMIKNPQPEKKYNVVFITVESLSATFMETFGGTDHLTPNLDALARQSMLFTRLYATGNRTVRGLEAITLSLPPTPGYSVVKRPNNENLFSLGSVLKDKGYDLKFLYGGYGYFDNMNYFFGNNGFKTIDRTDFAENEIDFANIWGVSDGSLYGKALQEGDKSYQQGKPFFQFLMTTSNHRPYTYPEGLIDIPSKTGRSGGVKYTDYTIGKFIEAAREKPWFQNTLFVIIADHCAGGKGLTFIPMQNYHIPAMIYAPGIIKPQKVNRIASQIDIVPTLLGILNFSYYSKFMGKDILKMKKEEERLVMGTYENLGYFRRGVLVTLSPLGRVQYEQVDLHDYSVQKVEKDPKLFKEAVSYYQFSDYLLTHHLYNASNPAPHS